MKPPNKLPLREQRVPEIGRKCLRNTNTSVSALLCLTPPYVPSNCRTSCIALFVGWFELLYQAQLELKLTTSVYVNWSWQRQCMWTEADNVSVCERQRQQAPYYVQFSLNLHNKYIGPLVFMRSWTKAAMPTSVFPFLWTHFAFLSSVLLLVKCVATCQRKQPQSVWN